MSARVSDRIHRVTEFQTVPIQPQTDLSACTVETRAEQKEVSGRRSWWCQIAWVLLRRWRCPLGTVNSMHDGSTTFVIPVPDPRGVADWPHAMSLLVQTVRSVAAQRRAPKPTVVVAATRGSDLPAELARLVDVVDVDRDWTPLPQEWAGPRQQAIREDKGTRVATGLVAAQPRGHAMVVDWDDLVSPWIGRWVSRHPDDAGWTVEAGYIFDDGRRPFVARLPRGLQRTCGTTLIIRADLLDIPATLDDLDLDWICTMYGSHRFAPTVLAERGTPLMPLPFAGAAYRVGTGLNGSRVAGVVTAARNVLGERRDVIPYLRPRIVIARFRG